MRLFFNDDLPEGEPANDLRGFGWTGNRQGVEGDVPTREGVRWVLDQHERLGFDLIFLVALSPAMTAEFAPMVLDTIGEWLRERSRWISIAVELGNEWDLRYKADEARRSWESVIASIRRKIGRTSYPHAVTLVTGGISSISTKALAWLRSALPTSGDYVVAFHGYTGNKPPSQYRGEEIQRVRDAAGGRTLWNTETGWHMAPTKTCFRTRPGLTEDEVLTYLNQDVAWHVSAGVDVYTVYQLNDGPTNTPGSRFGLRTNDETRWKEQASLPLRWRR